MNRNSSSVNKGLSLCFSAALFWVLFAGTAQAVSMYVKKPGVKLMAEDSSKSKVVAQLQEGASVEILKKSGKYYQVSTGGKTGWVFKFYLSSSAPAGGGGGDADLLGSLGGRQKVAANETGSSSSIRGLSPTSQELAQKKGIPKESVQAVQAMESYQISNNDLDQFLQEGQLGEYAQ
ncbi:MAG: SH3 domain-containing protein [Candidatus Nitrohelix vancouverensis]|uniref:SH3 domain-containing protein n=1 Tax=Candidatus Nitrohelix vancouverensis TaxID=2705534 RepID=A0A7T0C1D8_9BACT|nr:MAG: SH3 domain-containing protein [Candidatus Nitrohelix vancouverensis]